MLDILMCISGYCIAIQRSLDKELPTEREFGNFVDHYAVAVKKDSTDNVPSLKACLEVILLTLQQIIQV